MAGSVLVAQPREEREPATREARLAGLLARVRWPLVAIVVASATLTIWFVLQCVQYFIQPDELEYLQQSRQIWSEFHPLLPSDSAFNSWSQLQPILLSPVWGLFHDTNTAHKVMGVVNALLMVSTALPAYLLAMRVVGRRRLAYLVAFLTVFIPWMAAASTMMTEVAAYPAFLWGVLCVQRAVARPSARGDLIGLAGVAIAYFGRPQLAVLGVALVVGLIVQELRYALVDTDPLARRRDRLKAGLRPALHRHRYAIGVAVIALVGYVIVRPNLFGGYSRQGVGGNILNATGLWTFSRESLAYVAVGLALVPMAMGAAWALQTLWRPLTREQHAFAVIAVVTSAVLVVIVGGFTARYTPQGINSRYLFYLCPLLFVGMTALVADRRPATIPLLLAAAGTAWLVYGATISQSGPSLVSPDQTFHTVLIGRAPQIGKVIGLPLLTFPHLMAVAAVIAIVLLALARRSRWTRASGVIALALVTLFCVAETGYSLRKIADTQKGVSQDFLQGRRWIDVAMPPGQHADVIASTMGDPASSYGVWWDVSFWNRTTGQTLQLPTTPDLQQPFPQQFAFAPDGTMYDYTKVGYQPLSAGPYFVKAGSDRSFGLRDEQVVVERFGIRLIRTSTPTRAAWQLAGTLDDTGRLAQGAPAAKLIAFQRTPNERQIPVKVTLGTWPDGGTGVQRYRFGRHRGTLRAGQTVTLTGVAHRSGIPPNAFVSIPLRAPGAADTTRGIQVLNVWIG